MVQLRYETLCNSYRYHHLKNVIPLPLQNGEYESQVKYGKLTRPFVSKGLAGERDCTHCVGVN